MANTCTHCHVVQVLIDEGDNNTHKIGKIKLLSLFSETGNVPNACTWLFLI